MAKQVQPQPIDLTTSQVAEKLGITNLAVRGLINRGRFPNVRKLPPMNGTYLIPYSDFQEYLKYREARNKKRRQAVEETV